MIKARSHFRHVSGQHIGSRTRLVIRSRTGSAWELEIVGLIVANSLEGDARNRDLLEGTIRITKPVREPTYWSAIWPSITSRYNDHPESVATTWSLSFAKVGQASTTAAELLRACAFLAPDAIPEELLVEVLKTPLSLPERRRGLGGWFSQFISGHRKKSAATPLIGQTWEVNETVAVLRAYSLIAHNPRAQTLTVHRLVQAVIRHSMPTEAQQQWMQRVVHAVKAALPDPTFANRALYERCLPHALVCATWIEQTSLATPEAAHLLSQSGRYLNSRMQYREAEPLLKRALDIRKQKLGDMHPDTATNLHNLAGLYWDQGKYGEAVSLLKRTLAISEQALGAEHPDTATSLNALAELYRAQGKYVEAEPLYQRALTIFERELGSSHPDTATGLVLQL